MKNDGSESTNVREESKSNAHDEKHAGESKVRRGGLSLIHYVFMIFLAIIVGLFLLYRFNQVPQETGEEWRVRAILYPPDGELEIELDGKTLKRGKSTEIVHSTDESMVDPPLWVELDTTQPIERVEDGKRCCTQTVPTGLVLPAEIFSTDMKNSVPLFLQPGWSYELADLSELKVSMNLTSIPDDPIAALEPDQNYKVILKGKAFEATLILDAKTLGYRNVDRFMMLRRSRAVSGSMIDYDVTLRNLKTEEMRLAVMFFGKEGLVIPKLLDDNGNLREERFKAYTYLPEIQRVEILGQPFDALAMITGSESGLIASSVDPVFATNKIWGVSWGIIVVLGAYLVILVLRGGSVFRSMDKERLEKWDELPWYQKAAKLPILLCVSSSGRVRLSYTQILWWTFILLFGLVFVVVTTRELLEINRRILWLLAIAAITALLSNIMRGIREVRIPKEYSNGILVNRLPRYRDLLSVADRISVLKLQIVVFNLFVGIYVIWMLIGVGNLPDIDENLIILMAVSNATYLFGEATEERRWQKINGLIETIDNTRDRLVYASYSPNAKSEEDALLNLTAERDEINAKKKPLSIEDLRMLRDIENDLSRLEEIREIKRDLQQCLIHKFTDPEDWEKMKRHLRLLMVSRSLGQAPGASS